MSIFTFESDYPSTCSLVFNNQNEPCEVCGATPDEGCVCSPCPVCGEIGDAYCFKEHGMTLTKKQQDRLARIDKEWEERVKDAALHAELDNLLWEEG